MMDPLPLKRATPGELRAHLTDTLAAYLPPEACREVEAVLDQATEALDGDVRASGDPFFVHSLGVALSLAELKMDPAGLEAGILLAAYERGRVTASDLGSRIRVAPQAPELLETTSRISRYGFRRGGLSDPESFRKLILTLAKDLRVILIKLADRLDSLRTLQFLPADEQRVIAQETMDIYAPLANRLGLYRFKRELEDQAFRFLQPEKYQKLKALVAKTQAERASLVEEARREIAAMLAENGLEGEIGGRGKHFWSIQRKMEERALDFADLYDITALRVIVETIAHCYQVLGLIHHRWRPIPGTFDDYIAVPKPNGYQSLHTAVIGPGNERIEVQIRTREMHDIAENGVAAHWMYKESARRGAGEDRLRQFGWLHDMLAGGEGVFDHAVLETLRTDLFDDQIFVFTPAGDVRELSAGATPLDFAYAVHTDVGHTCVGAKVNGRIAPLSDELKNGDIVEVITHPRAKPSPDWLEFVRTHRARQKIRHFLGETRRLQERARGRDLLERAAKERSVPMSRLLKDEPRVAKALEKLRCRTLDELHLSLGREDLTPDAVLEALSPETAAAPPPPLPLPETVPAKPVRHPSTIVVAGQNDMLVRYAKCCNPLLGDAIVGFVTRGRGVTIHRKDCPRLEKEAEERVLDAEWAGKSRETLPVKIHITAERPAVQTAVAALLKKMDVPLASGAVQSRDGCTLMDFVLLVRSADEIRTVLEKLRALRGVLDVSRSGA